MSLVRIGVHLAAVAKGVKPLPALQDPAWKMLGIVAGILSLVIDFITAAGLFVELWKRRHSVVREAIELLESDSVYALSYRPAASVVDEVIVLCISEFYPHRLQV